MNVHELNTHPVYENFVPPEGPTLCDIAFIGEAPGEQEEYDHRPFVGTSGKILNGKLHRVGILRHKSYIDNVIPFRPKTFYKYRDALGYNVKMPKNENDFSIFWSGKHPTQALVAYRDELLARLDKVSANVIVALGASPLWALTGKEGISKWRGSILPCTLPSGRIVKVIPTYHPAYVAREWKLGAVMECDLLKAKEQSTFSSIPSVQRELLIAPTFDDVERYIFASDWSRVGPDIETSPVNITCVGLGKSPTLAMSIPTTKHYWGSTHKQHNVLKMIEHLLTRKDIDKVLQNLPFDFQYLFRIFSIYIEKPWHDTMVMQHACYPDLTAEQKDDVSTKRSGSFKTKSLAFLASVYTNEPYYKDDLKVWRDGGSSDEDLWRYNARDCAVTLECADALWREMRELKVTQTYAFMMDLVEPLLFMMVNGMKIDLNARDAHVKAMVEKLHTNQEAIRQKYGDINVRSSKQVIELIQKLGLRVPTKDGKPTTEKKALDKLAAKSPEFKNIIYVREASTLLSNHLQAPVDPITQRWHCSYNSTGTSTGRLSSSAGVFGSATNLQNVKKSIRDIIIADEGLVFTAADLKGAEAMIVAYMSDDEILIDLFERNENVHTYTATDIIWPGKTKEDIAADKAIKSKAGLDTESLYYMAKRTRHSGNYLIGAYTLALDLKIEKSAAQIILQNFYDRSPKLSQWHNEVTIDLQRNQQTLTTPMGRKRKFFARYGPDLIKEAVAYLPQSTVSDILNTGLKRIYYELCSKHKHYYLMANNHDEVLLAHPPEDTEYVHNSMRTLMTVPLTIKNRVCSIPIEIKTGPNWRDMEEIK